MEMREATKEERKSVSDYMKNVGVKTGIKFDIRENGKMDGIEKVCCNCRHNIRKGEITNIECYCEIDNHHIGYVSCFTDKCKRWAKGK